MSRKHKNAVLHFLQRFADAPEQPIPFEDAVKGLSSDLVKRENRPLWDENTPREGRSWYLQREKGLIAYSRYAAALMLKPFARGGHLLAENYIEAVVREEIRKHGSEAISRFNPEIFDWPDFMEWKRQKDPKFFERLGQWQFKGKDLGKYAPDFRIRLYATMYDRCALSPLEFCTDSWAASLINSLQLAADWPAQAKETNEEAIRGWRKLLGLKLTRPVVAKLGESAARTTIFDHIAARKHGIPPQPDLR